MIFNKYNSVKKRATSVVGSSSSSSSSGGGYGSNLNNSDGSVNRKLWGNDDTGNNDINESLIVQGNIYCVEEIETPDDVDEDYEPEEPDVSEVFTEEDGSGNHYVQNKLRVDGRGDFKAIQYQSGYNLPDDDDSSKLASTEWVNKKFDAHKKLTVKDSKGNTLGEFDNSEDKTITINNFSNVSELNNDAGYITADDIPDIPEIDKNAPVILFSGIVHSNNNDGSLTFQPWVVRPLCYSQHTSVKEIKLSYLEIDGQKKCTLVVEVVPKEGWTVKPTSMHSSVSLDSHCNPAVDFGGNRRSQGYWTTGGVFPTGDLYIQVWRTLDDNNDSTINDQVAYSAQEMNITIFGLGYKN